MGKRVGFGATFASAIIFSVLLISNFAILIGSDQRARLTAESDAESYLYDRVQVMAGAEGITLLEQVQTLVSSRVFPCPGLPAAVASAVGMIQTSQTEGALTVNVSLTNGPNYTRSEDKGIYQPYNGSVRGSLNVFLTATELTTSSLFGVQFHESETSYLTLPARLSAIESYCEASISSIASDLGKVPTKGCNSTDISATTSAENQLLEQNAEAAGLASRISYSILGGPKCVVGYVLEVSQRGIAGPGGPFTLTAEGGGTVLLESPV